MQFKEVVPVSWLSDLGQVSLVENIQQSIFNIQCSDAELAKKQILQLAIQKNLNIISLQSEEKRLEDIFRALTTSAH